MNESSLKKALAKLNISGLRYFDSIGSTNDEALAWAASGAKDLSLVIADEQTQGRGRLNRAWFTPKGTALAFSLILRPSESLRPHLSRIAGVAALSISDSCFRLGLAPRIKWPNDILLDGKKTAGILIESVWSGEDVDSLVIGIGVNVRRGSVPPLEALRLPATSLEDEMNQEPPAREHILRDIVEAFLSWRERIGSDELTRAWEARLAYRDEQVQVEQGGETTVRGILRGIEADGSLRLQDLRGKFIAVRVGDVSLSLSP
jgi:BirA family biotin operon repressor/biotin-[acetyl-CoA-carboxylase] ligase